jgi:lipoyl(octanoyl) transferase
MQDQLRARRQAEELPDVLLVLEHPPTYTRGRRSGVAELPLGEDTYRARGIDVVDTNRGGKVTYHGPGQLVGYTIMRVADVVAHVRTLEDAIVGALSDCSISAHSRADEGPAYTGVWVQDRKIASIGVHVSRGVTTHGFAINVHNDLEPFTWIVPCGLEGVRMTSIAAERASEPRGGPQAPLPADFPALVGKRLCMLLRRHARLVGPDALGLVTEAPTAAVAA